MADRALSPDEQALALATKRDVQAAGGLEVCERESGLSDTHLSRCCSPNQRDSITIRDAATITALGHGAPGHPHILHAMARMAGGVFVKLLEGAADSTALQMTILELSSELGDVAQAAREACSGTSAGGAQILPKEAHAIIDHLDDLDRCSARLRRQLEQIAKGDDAPTP